MRPSTTRHNTRDQARGRRAALCLSNAAQWGRRFKGAIVVSELHNTHLRHGSSDRILHQAASQWSSECRLVTLSPVRSLVFLSRRTAARLQTDCVEDYLPTVVPCLLTTKYLRATGTAKILVLKNCKS